MIKLANISVKYDRRYGKNTIKNINLKMHTETGMEAYRNYSTLLKQLTNIK